MALVMPYARCGSMIDPRANEAVKDCCRERLKDVYNACSYLAEGAYQSQGKSLGGLRTPSGAQHLTDATNELLLDDALMPIFTPKSLCAR